jgi:hypothetical protein
MSKIHALLSAGVLIGLVACRDADPTGILEPTSEIQFAIVSGNDQQAPAGSELPAPIVVKVTNTSGTAVAGQLVNFVVTQGGGSVFAGRAITNSSGIAQEWWTLGATPGANTLEVRAVDSSTGQPRVFGTFRATGLDPSGAGTLAIGEFGRVTVSQKGEEWHTVTLGRTFTNPVVVMGPVSYNGSAPVTARVRNVQSDRFEFQLDEWDYLDQAHTTETVSYLVVEVGTHQLPDGTPVQAGVATSVTDSWQTVTLTGFGSAPVVLSQVGSVNDAASVVTRHKTPSRTSFQVRLQESQASDGTHPAEAVHWIAIGKTTVPGVLEVAATPNSVTDAWSPVAFGQSYTGPAFLATMQSYDGVDPAGLRYQALGGSGVEVKVEEEASFDAEVTHTTEVVGYVVLGAGSGLAAGTLLGAP